MDHSPKFLEVVREAKARVREVTVEDVRQRQLRGDSFELVDVREDHEWAKGHLPGARHLGRGILERDVEQAIPNFDREIVLYCGGGFRSALAADMLQKMGYTRVVSMDGGWRGWTTAHHPTVTPKAST
ncbi:MAG: rhodanese-like domain-containing protein [Polyangiales bacterium]